VQNKEKVMNYTIVEQDDVVVLSLSGKIMGGPEASEINGKINQLIDDGKLKILINLKEVEWMNSSGLGILIDAVTVLKNNNGALRLVNVSDRIKNLLKITKLDTVFDIRDSIDDAKESL
jgi:anti-sigma B factor antagonist